MSFCRITGRARSLPKPNFFPIIPPISPADALKLCRITGKRADEHGYMPVIEMGRRPEGLRCPITGKYVDRKKVGLPISCNDANRNLRLSSQEEPKEELGVNDNELLSNMGTLFAHDTRNNYKYMTPILKRDVMDKGDLRTFEELQRVLNKLKKKDEGEEKEKVFVYLLSSLECGLIVPAEVEEAIRDGDLESISLAKSGQRAVFKIRGFKRTLSVPLKEVDPSSNNGKKFVIFDGRGQSDETLIKQRQVIEGRKQKTLANRQIFEDLEEKADKEMKIEKQQQKANKIKSSKAFSKRSREAFLKRIAAFRDKFMSSKNMSAYGDFQEALRTNVHKLDWNAIGGLKSKAENQPFKVPKKRPKLSKLKNLHSTSCRRIKNVYAPEQRGLELIPFSAVADSFSPQQCQISPELLNFITDTKREGLTHQRGATASLKSMFACEDSHKSLPSLKEFEELTVAGIDGSILAVGCMYDDGSGEGPKFVENPSDAPPGANLIVGAVVRAPADGEGSGEPKFVPGERLGSAGPFVPGQRMASAKGEFIPGASLRGPDGKFQFIPGVIIPEGRFVAGQFVEGLEHDQEGAREMTAQFIKGQVVHTDKGSKFVEGETVSTDDGLKFVAGMMYPQTDGDASFLPGALVDVSSDESNFVPGQLLSARDEPLTFIPGRFCSSADGGEFVPGQLIHNEFVPGQTIDLGDEQKVFLPGAVVDGTFVPGVFDESDGDAFTAGVVLDSVDGLMFVGGRLIEDESGSVVVVPGKVMEGSTKFVPCRGPGDMSLRKSPEPGDCLDGQSLSMAFKKARPKNGIMVKTKDGTSRKVTLWCISFIMQMIILIEYASSRFYPDGELLPDVLANCCEAIPGRLECGEHGPTFVPGKSMELNGVRSFIPGKVVRDPDTGLESFVPGKVVQTKQGPKFVCGQVIQTEDGGEKFLPGVMQDTEQHGKIFVPAMEMQTKTGPVLIPGQVIRTDNGLKFVPGDIVSTDNGALFVPGLVIDSPEGARLLHGEVVQTPDGPRLLPPDVHDGQQFCVQGFDINVEEARLLLGRSASDATACNGANFGGADEEALLGGVGGAIVSPEALRALAEGFDAIPQANFIQSVGAGEDAEKMLDEEFLHAFDRPEVRKVVAKSFVDVMTELCEGLVDISPALEAYLIEKLKPSIESTLLYPGKKLNPAVDALRQILEKKGKSEIEDVLNLLAGIITCSIPVALKDSDADSSRGETSVLEERMFRAALMGCVEDAIKDILREDGLESREDLEEDLRQLVEMAKDLAPDEASSLLTAVTAAAQSRSNSKILDDLITQLSPSGELLLVSKRCTGSADSNDITDVEEKLMGVLNTNEQLQQAFQEMCKKSPEFISRVLSNLVQQHKDGDRSDLSASDIVHNAVVSSVEDECQKQLDEVIAQLEQAGDRGALTDTAVRSMLKQAIGLAKFLGRPHVAESLKEFLVDPACIDAIKNDSLTRAILKKILVMRKLAGKDEGKRRKLERLERYNPDDEDDDNSLKHFIDQSEALTRQPVRGKKLRKSKSVLLQKSKSTILTAKDIPMNAFLALKSAAADKDERWLQNFLSESILEDVPWECSKALILLKEGYQAIIPREASRSILLGEASYTLIDDNGIEFYLSPGDKKSREAGGNKTKEDQTKENKKVTMSDILRSDPHYKKAKSPEKQGDELASSKHSNKWMQQEELEDPLKTSAKNLARNRVLDREDPELMGEKMDSLEKYRPHNYEFNRKPLDSTDINDLRDYYSSLGLRERAIKRWNLLSGGSNDLESRSRSHYYGRQPSYGGEALTAQENEPQRRKSATAVYYGSNNPDAGNAGLEDILDRTRAARSRQQQFWQDEVENAKKRCGLPTREEEERAAAVEATRRVYDWERDEFLPPAESQPVRSGGAMSGKTRSMLEQLKESTMALQDLNNQVDEEDRYDRLHYGNRKLQQPLRKNLRPLCSPERDFTYHKRQPMHPGHIGRYGRDDESLNSPLKQMSLDEEMVYHQQGPRQKGCRQGQGLDHEIHSRRDDAHKNFGSFASVDSDLPQPSYSRESFNRRDISSPPATTSGWRDSEDVDGMIAELKRKTSGRDMRKVLRDMNNDDYKEDRLYSSYGRAPLQGDEGSEIGSQMPIRRGRGYLEDSEDKDDDKVYGFRNESYSGNKHNGCYDDAVEKSFLNKGRDLDSKNALTSTNHHRRAVFSPPSEEEEGVLGNRGRLRGSALLGRFEVPSTRFHRDSVSPATAVDQRKREGGPYCSDFVPSILSEDFNKGIVNDGGTRLAITPNRFEGKQAEDDVLLTTPLKKLSSHRRGRSCTPVDAIANPKKAE